MNLEKKVIYDKMMYYHNRYDYPNTLKYYNELMALEPNNNEAHLFVGIAHFHNGFYEQAILCYKKILPMTAEIYYKIGVSYYNLNDMENSKEYFM